MCKLTLTAGLCVIIASLGLPGLATRTPLHGGKRCHGKKDGNFPNPGDPKTFYQCVAGKTYVKPCAAGLVYSRSKKVCDSPGNTPQGFCNGKADGIYEKADDPKSFYRCGAGKTYVQPCPAGLVYSQSKNVCDYPANNLQGYCYGRADGNYRNPDDQYSFYQCVAGNTYVQPCPTGLVYSQSKNVCDYPANNLQGYCYGRADGNYRNPDDQYSFYQCVAGNTYVQPCPAGLVYSQSKNVCDYPANNLQGYCYGRADGNYRNPDDQHSFYQCVAEIIYLHQCPAGLVYRPCKNACDFPAQP